MRKILIFAYILSCFAWTGCSLHKSLYQKEYPYYKNNAYYFSPHIMPNVSNQMLHPGYWISKIKNPDSLIYTSLDIENINQSIRKKQLVQTLIQGNNLSENNELNTLAWNQMQETKRYLIKKELYTPTGEKPDIRDRERIVGLFPDSLVAFSSLKISQYAIFNRFSDEKMIPDSLNLTEKPFDDEFDYMQNNAHDMGAIIYAFCYSPDKMWIYQINQSSSGWVPSSHFTFLNNESTLLTNPIITIQNPYADIWADSLKLNYINSSRMGSKFYILDKTNNHLYKIVLPMNDSLSFAFIDKADVVEGVKPLTSRNLILDMFKWMNTPYGWGDKNQFVDCSKMIQLTFSLYGIDMPRNGGSQALVSQNILSRSDFSDNEKLDFITNHAIPGLTLLRFPGHIMLYIGNEKGDAYAIHCLYRYIENYSGENYSRVTNRVVLSDLSLGKGSPRKSLLQRITQIAIVGKD